MVTTHDKTTLSTTPDRRFLRQNRILDKASFGRVFKSAKRSKDGFFTVLYRANGTTQSRLGLAISKKNCRLAVGRNRLKRIVRESFRAHQTELTGIDIVVLNQANTHTAENKALFGSLERHWRKCQRATRMIAEQEKG